MARGQKHRGGVARGGMRGGGGGGNRGGHAGPATQKTPGHVAKPLVAFLPEKLNVVPKHVPIPGVITNAFPEFHNTQSYFSALERLCPEYGGSYSAYTHTWIGISGELVSRIERDPESVFQAAIHMTNGDVQRVFVKRIHLLDATAAMEGDYVWPVDGALPAPSELWKRALAKINDPMNEAYVDALFACVAHNLVQEGVSPHWCRSFGTMTARVEKYLYNISDEYHSMKNEPWWARNQKLGLFKVFNDDEQTPAVDNSLFLTTGLSELDADDFLTVDEAGTVIGGERGGAVAGNGESPDCDDIETDGSPAVQLSAPKLRLKRLSPGSSDGGSSSSCSSESDELEMFAEFRDFPVQVTFLERADGTMDELLDEEDEDNVTLAETKEARWTSWLFQVIAGLTVAQHMFGFVHNDLHTNNVMWSGTGVTHLVYRIHKGKEVFYMKVPTYGRVMKIIDFGRASFHLPDPAGFFISDAFYPGNDAATQYNCEPFYDSSEGKKVEPNTSFDLCRLAVSLLESLYDERPAAVTPVKIMSKEGGKLYTETVSSVYNMLWEWLQDDNGHNVLRKANGEERYPDFELYRVLASSVHKAVPSKQIEKPIFAGFRCNEKDISPDTTVFDIYI